MECCETLAVFRKLFRVPQAFTARKKTLREKEKESRLFIRDYQNVVPLREKRQNAYKSGNEDRIFSSVDKYKRLSKTGCEAISG